LIRPGDIRFPKPPPTTGGFFLATFSVRSRDGFFAESCSDAETGLKAASKRDAFGSS
jgi:hypothetical protein